MPEDTLCSSADCAKPSKTRGWCASHYHQWRKANGLVKYRPGRKRSRVGGGRGFLEDAPCGRCAKRFTPTRIGHIYCSTECGRRAGRDSLSRVCAEGSCLRAVRAKDLCSVHYDQKFRGSSQRHRASGHGENAERIVREDIGNRDAWVCGICADPIDPLTRWPDPASQSLDHIVPLSKGGLHCESNVRIAHLGCNARRGNRT